MTLDTSTEICILPRLAKGSLVRAKSESGSAAIGGEVVGVQPLLAQHDRIDRQSPDIPNEAREVIGDLRVRRLILSRRGRNRLHLTEAVDLHDPWCYGAAQ